MANDRHRVSDELPDEESFDHVQEQPETETDPLSQWLRLVAGGLVFVLLVTTLSFMFYLRSIDAPRTAQERDIELYRAAVTSDPDTQLNHILLAYAYARADRYDDAMRSIDDAFIISRNAPALIARADVLRLSGRFSEAVDAYDGARPDVERAYQNTLLELRKQNIGKVPPDTQLGQLLFGRGLALLELGDFESAQADFEEALEISPTDATLLVALGDTYAALSNVASATASFEAALEFVPDMPEARVGLRELDLDQEE